MTDILEHAVARDPGLAVVGMIDDANLAAEARRTRADVLIVVQKAQDERASLAHLFRSRPRMKVLTIVASGDSGALYELRPHRTYLAGITAETLSQAIRDPAGAKRMPRQRRPRRPRRDIVAV